MTQHTPHDPDLDWDYDQSATPGENVRTLLVAADAAGWTIGDCKQFAFRHIPGAGPKTVARNVEAVEVSLAKHSAAEYM